MSTTNNTALLTTNQAIINTTSNKTFLWNRRSEKGVFTNGGGSPVTILEGTVMGRVSATGKLKPCVAAASDGSQFPIGILLSDYIVAAGADANISICVSGDIAAENLIFNASENLSTVVSGVQMRDRIQGGSVGLKLIYSSEQTQFDNQ